MKLRRRPEPVSVRASDVPATTDPHNRLHGAVRASIVPSIYYCCVGEPLQPAPMIECKDIRWAVPGARVPSTSPLRQIPNRG
jgi:hypothetical protein